MSNKRVKSVFVRQRASPEGETKEQRLVHLEKEKKERDCLGRTKAMNKGKKVRRTTKKKQRSDYK